MEHQHDDDFAHLHVHSDASRIDGLGPVHRLVAGAASLGFKSLGLTDHGSLANAIAFTAACEQAEIKPLLGMEAYVGLGGKRYHLTLLADGSEGFRTLVELNNLGQRGPDAMRPTFDLWALERHNQGLVVMTGCPSSPMQDNEWDDAKDIATRLKGILGSRLMAEVMLIGASSAPWERAGKLARDVGLAPVLTNDAHFPFAGDAAIHQILVKLQAGFSYAGDLLYLATAEELRERQRTMAPGYARLFESALTNAGSLAQKLHRVEFTSTPKLPHIPDADKQLHTKVAMAFLSKPRMCFGPLADTYENRLEDELQVITDMGFAAYFLILEDIVAYAKANQVRVGPGRGSGTGSLVLYLLNISEIDPIEFGLSFDRFLNRKRSEMPDVDVDFEAERRPQVLAYATHRWGALPVATYNRWNHRSLVHDLARVFHIPRNLDDAAADEGEKGPEWRRLAGRYEQFGQSYDTMLGQIRHIGQHAGGIVIVDEDTPVPLERASGGDMIAGWVEGEHRELTRAGITKFDLLGVTAFSTLRRLEEQHGRRAPDPIDDSPVFDQFKRGDMLGIFQFAGSQGIRDFTVEVQPRTFMDLVAINALYRPGALDSGATKNYPAWRLKPRLLDPLIDPILAETFGVICFQEQFMEIFAAVTDQTMADADLARKVLSKARPGQPEWEEKMAQLQMEFFDGCTKHGLTDKKAKEIWGEIVTHTRYSFNKSHSVAYARVAWDMAWWRYTYPVDFYAATLSTDRDSWQNLIFTIIANGTLIKPPNVNRSTADFESDGTSIYLPLSVVRFLGEGGVASIMQERPYASVADFVSRVPKRSVNTRVRKGLWELGAFEGIPGTADDLGIVPTIYDSDKERQEVCMGMFLPDPAFLAAVAVAQSQGFAAGLISSIEERESKYGTYKVYGLLPDGNGAFWSRGLPDIAVGSEVKLRIKRDSGKILEVKPLR